MLKWVFASTFALTTVVLLAMGGKGYHAIHMNGRLCSAHADLEKNCQSCHVPWSRTRVRKAKCSTDDCHGSVREETSHIPPEVTTPCGECHTEHRGRGATVILPMEDGPCRECHEKDIAEGDHKFRAKCLSCHYYHLPCPKAPPAERQYERMENPHGDHLELVTTLLSLKEGEATCRHCHGEEDALRSPSHEDCGGPECHQNTDRTKPSKECQQCHTLRDRTKETGIIFSHKGHTKDKIEVGCDECHIIKDPKPKFVKVNVEFCVECHQVKHEIDKDITTKECAICHTRPQPVKRASVRFHHRDHTENLCTKCHADMAKAEKPSSLKLIRPAHCADCHDESGQATP